MSYNANLNFPIGDGTQSVQAPIMKPLNKPSNYFFYYFYLFLQWYLVNTKEIV